MRLHPLLCKSLLALGLMPLLMGAAVYRWVDEDGVVNYTQHKPEGVAAELVSESGRRSQASPSPRATPETDDASPTSPVSGEGAGQQALTDEQQEMLSDLRAAEEARQAEIARVRQHNCQQARDVLGRLTQRGRIRVTGSDGQERVLPEEERQQRIDEAQRAVAANCTNTASR